MKRSSYLILGGLVIVGLYLYFKKKQNILNNKSDNLGVNLISEDADNEAIPELSTRILPYVGSTVRAKYIGTTLILGKGIILSPGDIIEGEMLGTTTLMYSVKLTEASDLGNYENTIQLPIHTKDLTEITVL